MNHPGWLPICFEWNCNPPTVGIQWLVLRSVISSSRALPPPSATCQVGSACQIHFRYQWGWGVFYPLPPLAPPPLPYGFQIILLLCFHLSLVPSLPLLYTDSMTLSWCTILLLSHLFHPLFTRLPSLQFFPFTNTVNGPINAYCYSTSTCLFSLTPPELSMSLSIRLWHTSHKPTILTRGLFFKRDHPPYHYILVGRPRGGSYIGVTYSPLPQNNCNSPLPLPFLVVISQLFSCIIFINDCICIWTVSPG